MINYMKYINDLINSSDKNKLKQIQWITNLTNTDKAQEIFNIWYDEMSKE